jgi:hypothetical protein
MDLQPTSLFPTCKSFALGLVVGIALFGVVGRLPTASMPMPRQKQIPGRMGMTEQERLIELERRMANVEKQLATLQKWEVKAPFRVVDLGIGLSLR